MLLVRRWVVSRDCLGFVAQMVTNNRELAEIRPIFNITNNHE